MCVNILGFILLVMAFSWIVRVFARCPGKRVTDARTCNAIYGAGSRAVFAPLRKVEKKKSAALFLEEMFETPHTEEHLKIAPSSWVLEK